MDIKQDTFYYLEDLTNEDGSKWKRILEYAISKAEFVEFTASTDQGEEPSLLKGLEPFLKERFHSTWRWGSKQRNKVVTFLRYTLAPEVITFLQSFATLQDMHLAEPYVGEDPAFYVGETALVWTISHEVWSYLLLSEEEATTWREQGFDLDPQARLLPMTLTRKGE